MVAAAMMLGAVAQGVIGGLNGTNVMAVRETQLQTNAPLAAQGRASKAIEFSGGQASRTLSDGAMFELITMCHEQGWKLVAGHSGTRAGESNFVLTTATTRAKGGGNHHHDCKFVHGRCSSLPPLPLHHRSPHAMLNQCVRGWRLNFLNVDHRDKTAYATARGCVAVPITSLSLTFCPSMCSFLWRRHTHVDFNWGYGAMHEADLKMFCATRGILLDEHVSGDREGQQVQYTITIRDVEFDDAYLDSHYVQW